MASTFSPSLRLELMATGDQSGTWGDTTNTNLGTLLEQAITGVLSVAQGDVANLTLTTVNGGSDQARNAVVNLTGAMTANRNVVVQTANKLYLIRNATTGGFTITAKTAAGTGVAIPNGTSRGVYSDGTNVVDGYSGPWTPSTNDGAALGTTTVSWSDLFLATGGVINWNAGNVTLTQSANALAFAGVTSGVSFDGPVNLSTTAAGTLLTLTSTDAGATSGPDFEQYRNSASPATNDVLGVHYWYGRDSAGNKQEYASQQVTIVDATSTSEDAVSEDYVTVGGARTAFMRRGALASGTADPNAVGLPKGQLSFPATQNASSDVNTLDDYEEGTWTPSVGGSATYTARSGTYTKVGNRVLWGMQMIINAIGTGGGNTIVGLPFTAAANPAFAAASVGYFANLSVSVVYLGAVVSGGSATIAVYSTAAATATLGLNNIFTSGTQIYISGQYEAA